MLFHDFVQRLLKRITEWLYYYTSLGSAGERLASTDPLTTELSDPTFLPWYIRQYLSKPWQWPRTEAEGQEGGLWASEQAGGPV